VEIAGCAAIVIDDGVATRATTGGIARRASTRSEAPCAAPTDSLAELRHEADDVNA
jgi:hypothetical protein